MKLWNINLDFLELYSITIMLPQLNDLSIQTYLKYKEKYNNLPQTSVAMGSNVDARLEATITYMSI